MSLRRSSREILDWSISSSSPTVDWTELPPSWPLPALHAGLTAT
jgi:hypothetical protein